MCLPSIDPLFRSLLHCCNTGVGSNPARGLHVLLFIDDVSGQLYLGRQFPVLIELQTGNQKDGQSTVGEKSRLPIGNRTPDVLPVVAYFYSCMCSLFNGTVSNSDCTVSNVWMIAIQGM
jgi:hypothetical protein